MLCNGDLCCSSPARLHFLCLLSMLSPAYSRQNHSWWVFSVEVQPTDLNWTKTSSSGFDLLNKSFANGASLLCCIVIHSYTPWPVVSRGVRADACPELLSFCYAGFGKSQSLSLTKKEALGCDHIRSVWAFLRLRVVPILLQDRWHVLENNTLLCQMSNTDQHLSRTEPLPLWL